ncbi:MAG: hypothetical protein ACJ70Z_08010 [Nitrososphaera sp.]
MSERTHEFEMLASERELREGDASVPLPRLSGSIFAVLAIADRCKFLQCSCNYRDNFEALSQLV